MDKHDIIVIGSSAGGVEALQQLCSNLPADLRASVFIVQHLSPTSQSILPRLLDRAGPLPATTPDDGEAIRPGHIYVAAPDRHMLIGEGRLHVGRGPRESRMRPSVNALFRSAAVAYGPRVIGLVLTGLLDDGTEGLIAISRAGGITAVQDPADALWPGMPSSALANDHVQYSLPLTQLPALLVGLVGQPAGPAGQLPADILAEARIAGEGYPASLRLPPGPPGPLPATAGPGTPSPISCPDCGGVLNQISSEDSIRFRCQIGHAFTEHALVAAQSEELERAMGVALRTHRDRICLFQSMEADAIRRDQPHSAARWHSAMEEAEHLAQVLRSALTAISKPTEPIEPADLTG